MGRLPVLSNADDRKEKKKKKVPPWYFLIITIPCMAEKALQ